MADSTDLRIIEGTPKAVSRRRFIKGVIAGGAAVSSANYLFRASATQGQISGAGERLISINVNGQQRRVDVMKQETLAWTHPLQTGPDGHQAGLRPRRMRRLHRPHRRCAALLMLGAHAYGARPESHDHRRTGESRRNAAPRATGHHRRTRVPVRILHVRLHYGDGGILENKSKPHEVGIGARYLGKSLPVPGL